MKVIFSQRARKTWNRIGDIYCPAYDGLPAFSETGCVEQIDAVLVDSHQQDINDLTWLIRILGVVPTVLLKWLVLALDQSERCPNVIGRWMRLVRLALKGPVVSIYYGNLHSMGYQKATVHQHLGCETRCEHDEPESIIRLVEAGREK